MRARITRLRPRNSGESVISCVCVCGLLFNRRLWQGVTDLWINFARYGYLPK
jgi:hypothetical protein